MDYYQEIKDQIINNEVTKRIKEYSKSRSDLQTYYNVGKLLVEAGKHYGEGIIKKYSIRLTEEFGKGYTVTNLKYMRKFYIFIQKSHAMRDQLTWTHYRELMSLKNKDEIEYYINISIKHNLSYRQLHDKIKNKEYERLSEETKEKLKTKQEEKIEDFIKHPIFIKNTNQYKAISEKIVKQLILENIDSFLMELGDVFCYIKNEYKIRIGDQYNYIDLLLYNIKYNCYVVIELKVTELKKEYIGQIQVYMNYVDQKIKNSMQEKTIGIILVKKDNQFIMEYCSDKRIFKTTYVLT